YLGQLGADVVVHRNDKVAAADVIAAAPDAIRTLSFRLGVRLRWGSIQERRWQFGFHRQTTLNPSWLLSVTHRAKVSRAQCQRAAPLRRRSNSSSCLMAYPQCWPPT